MIKAFVLLLGLAQVAGAATFTVKCTTKYGGKTETVALRMNDQHKIVRWNDKKLASASSKSLFSIFGMNEEDAGIEYSKNFRAPNGYSILTVGTTADEMSLGVSLKDHKGFYSYSDHGSGNGNFKLTLTCNRL